MSTIHAPLGVYPGKEQPRLYDRVIETFRVRHYSRRSEQAYLYWIQRFLHFHRPRHPCDLAEEDVNRFLTHLAVQENVAASTQNQVQAAALFLYRQVSISNWIDWRELLEPDARRDCRWS